MAAAEVTVKIKPQMRVATWVGESHQQKHLDRDNKTYGTPQEGTKSHARGLKAQDHVAQEITDLCGVILNVGDAQPDGTVCVTFGRLFNVYTRISDKIVGMLNRARRHQLVQFEGEMLYQGQDNHVIITLVQVPESLSALWNKQMAKYLQD